MSPRPPKSVRDLLHAMREVDAAFLDLKFVDLYGTLQHLTLPRKAASEEALRHGLGFDGSSVRGFQPIDASDMTLVPDPSSAFLDPFFDDPTMSVFCDIIDPLEFQPYSRDPRGVARRAERMIRSLGIADEAYFGPELEFFVFDDVRFDLSTQHGFYHVDADAAFWNTGRGAERDGRGHRAGQKRAYFAAPPSDPHHNLRNKMAAVLDRVGLETELHHHEVASAGQNEIGFRFGPLTAQADRALKYKYVVKNVAARYGKIVTFMPKPLYGENGSGMHVHVSLFKDGQNLFYGPGGYADLSPMARQFIGGLLRHAPALCALTNPTTNSYRRLVPGYEAPINLVYSNRNRSACVRVPITGANSKAKRIEYRTPDPTANPYLAFAAILMAGVDGILRGLEPPDPVDVDVYELAGTPEGDAIANAPGSLAAALDALEGDHEFLLREGVFTSDLIERWVRDKRVGEVDYINLRPHPGEFQLYFDA